MYLKENNMKSIKLRVFFFFVVMLGMFFLGAGCGSQPVTETEKKGISRDEIKSRVDNSTQELDKVIKDVDVKSNVPTE